MTDFVEEYLKKNNLPVTRENYVGLNWAGDHDPKESLPGELEANLPSHLQLSGDKEKKEPTPAEHTRKKLGVIDRFSKEYQKREFNPTGDKPIVKT